MTRIAIVGSCITRDLWPVRGAGEQPLLYVSRSSLASLMSPRLAGLTLSEEPVGGLRRHEHAAVVADLAKTALDRLVRFRPTHLVFDFIDERFDLVAADGAIFTRSWEFETSGYGRLAAFQGARAIPRLSAAADRLWLTAAEELAALVRATPLVDARLILHSARWAHESDSGKGEPVPLQASILGEEPADIAAHNRLLARCEADLLRLMAPMTVVAAPAHRRADPQHRWGLSPFHYVAPYYAEIAAQLRDLGLTGFAEPDAATLVPA